MNWKLCGKTLALCLITTGAGLLQQPSLSWAYSSEAYSPYDPYFKQYAIRFIPEYDWRWLVAQCRQESGPDFDRFAVSHANAKGVCQFMGPTWIDMQLALGFVASPFSAKHNIKAAAFYMGRKLLPVWRGRGRTLMEKLPLAQSAYNAGTGTVLRAQRKANDARDWIDLSVYLPKEAQDYPRHIRRHYYKMVEGDSG